MTVPDGHPYLRLNSVNIYVRDQELSLNFYRQQLGFEIAFDAQLQSGQRWVAVSPPDGTAVLTLIQPDANSPSHQMIGRATGVVFVTDDVAHQYQTWSRRGVRFRHTPRLRRLKYQNESAPVWGEVFTRFEDPDGNGFTIVSLDQVSKALDAQRRENQKAHKPPGAAPNERRTQRTWLRQASLLCASSLKEARSGTTSGSRVGDCA